MKTLLCAASLFVIAITGAEAQQFCGTRAKAWEQFGPDSQFGERPMLTYRSQAGPDVEVWANLDKRTVTVFRKVEDEFCIIDLGVELEPAPLSNPLNYTPAQHPSGHDPYKGYVRSNGTSSCCNDRDCAPAPYNDELGVMQLPSGEWVDPRTHVNGDHTSPALYFSFDGKGHACVTGDGKLVCAFIPGEGA